MFVSIEGCIASGKSTAARLISEDLGTALVHEQTDRHPFLSEFYADPRRFAFETEIGFALIHYHQLHQLTDGNIVADFSPAKDLVFARMNLFGEDLEAFVRLYEVLQKRVPQPDVVVFLDLPPDECWRRCIARGRSFEMGITVEYLAALREKYLENLKTLGVQVEALEVTSGQSQREVAAAASGVVRRLLGTAL